MDGGEVGVDKWEGFCIPFPISGGRTAMLVEGISE